MDSFLVKSYPEIRPKKVEDIDDMCRFYRTCAGIAGRSHMPSLPEILEHLKAVRTAHEWLWRYVRDVRMMPETLKDLEKVSPQWSAGVEDIMSEANTLLEHFEYQHGVDLTYYVCCAHAFNWEFSSQPSWYEKYLTKGWGA